MKSPRCGVKDVLPPSKRGVSRDQPQAFHTLGLKWPRNEVTWKIVGYTGQLAQSIQRRAYYDAFRKWSDVTPLVFREVRGGNADILISYARYNHGDGSSFDGKGGTLAHAFFPGKQPIAGDTHFDDDEKWTMGTKEGTNLEIVAAHEFGHAIGMSHSNIQEALMAPYYQGYDPNFQLHRDDIAGIQSLYGRPRNTPRPTARPRPTPRPTAPSGGGSNCDLKFDVIFNGHDNRLYAVRGRNLYRFNRDGVGIESGYPKNARKVYQRFPKSPAAAVQDRYRRVYVFKDKRVFRYTGFRLDAGYPKRTIGKKNFFRYPQAALMWYDGRIYLFKGDKYSIWRDDYKEPPPGYPKTITSFWRGVPNNVEAAVRWNRYTYFFKGQNYVKLNDRSRSKYFGYPKKKAAPWLGCGPRTPK
ncbi:hypothetical protein FSP39_003123 [Pinctada imbricata]|uniref:Peptidase metallopeptidase domain-containing protein n=1 Tax=Pinctada imbricata TaxID=66713 RepID=A0AA89BLF7_PINIB|nr:hypothetical protein FSP39_003123 [Pinctada imbricata]